MCAPDRYDLVYEINDWMSVGNRPDVSRAGRQWAELYRVLTQEAGARVELVQQETGAPDMVFTANAGIVDRKRGGRVLMSNFRHAERQVEVEPFRRWFEANGFETVTPPDEFKFEGEGDALFAGETLVAGYLKRSDIASHRWLSEQLGCQVLSLELVHGRWYHLDTAFFALSDSLVAYYPGAFDPYAQQVIEDRFETIVVEDDEALHFACNAVVLGRTIVMPAGCPKLKAEMESRGYRVFDVSLTEFLKAGGAAKCLVLHLNLYPVP
jgi:N-dimethylarginine dimethylaminohydrolase